MRLKKIREINIKSLFGKLIIGFSVNLLLILKATLKGRGQG